jgi:hypothetical protein
VTRLCRKTGHGSLCGGVTEPIADLVPRFKELEQAIADTVADIENSEDE